MTARGDGAGPRTRLPAPRARGAERLLWLPALGLVALAAVLLIWIPPFQCYPVLGSATDPGALAVAALCLCMLVFALVVVERCSPS